MNIVMYLDGALAILSKGFAPDVGEVDFHWLTVLKGYLEGGINLAGGREEYVEMIKPLGEIIDNMSPTASAMPPGVATAEEVAKDMERRIEDL